MKNLLLVLIIIPFIFNSCNGGVESWNKTFGGDEVKKWSKTFDGLWGNSVQQTTDGGYIITGYGKSLKGDVIDFFLLKIDSDGNEQWRKTFGLMLSNSVQQTTDGGYIITGLGEKGYFLLKTDGNGNEEWSKFFDGNKSVSWNPKRSVQQTTDGGYITTGGETDCFLLKTDGNGNEEWSKSFRENNNLLYNDWISLKSHSVQQTTDGGYIITGGKMDMTIGGKNCIFLLKTDVNGVEQWRKTFGESLVMTEGNSVQQTTDGGYVIIGRINSKIYLLKTDSYGNEVWSKTFGGKGNDKGNSGQQTTDGGYIITGKLKSFGDGGYNVFLLKTDENGEEQWIKTFGGTDYSEGHSVQQTTDGGYIITGYKVVNENYEVYLLKTDENGNIDE